MKKIFIKSSHASLEYDQARMLVDLGYKVGGDFDIGSKQRKKIDGVTDRNSNVEDFDIVLLHQTPDFEIVMTNYLNMGKKVIINAFGQGCDRQHKIVADLCKTNPNAYVCSYSKKDYEIYRRLDVPQHKLEMIRFSKYLEQDFKPWLGKWPVCYISCNAIYRRGEGCGWEILKQVEASGLPIILGGGETAENTEFGIGETPEAGMRNIYRHAMCHLHLGTKPAPITLTLIEAFCSGTPVVAYHNGCGLMEEGFELDFQDSVPGLIGAIHKILHNPVERRNQHEKSLRNGQQFDIRKTGQEWKTLIERI